MKMNSITNMEHRLAIYKMRVAYAKERERYLELEYDTDRLDYEEYIRKSVFWIHVQEYWRWRIEQWTA